MVMNVSLLAVPWTLTYRSLLSRDAVFPEQCNANTATGTETENLWPSHHFSFNKLPDWMDLCCPAAVQKRTLCSPPGEQRAPKQLGFCQASVTYCFPGRGIPFPVLDLILDTHPSCPDVRRGWGLPVYDDIIAQPGGAYVQQSPV